MQAQEGADDRAQNAGAEHDRGGDRQHAAGCGMLAGGRQFGFLKVVEHALADHGVALAGVGQAHVAGGAVQQLGTDMALDEGDCAGDGGRRATEATPGGGQTSRIERGDEHPHRIESVNHSSVPRNKDFSTIGIPAADTMQ